MSSWEHLARTFVKDLGVRGFAARSQETYRQDLQTFLGYLELHPEVQRPADITFDLLQEYQMFLYERRAGTGSA